MEFHKVAGHARITYGTESSILYKEEKDEREKDMYEYLQKTSLYEYMPKYYGYDAVSQRLIIENLTYGYTDPYVMDVKIGSRKNNKPHTSFGGMFSIKGITNCEIANVNSERNDDETLSLLSSYAFPVGGDNSKMILTKWIDKMHKIINEIQKLEIKFNGSSIMFIRDDEKYDVFLIDFSRAEKSIGTDNGIIRGIYELIKCLKALST